MYYFCVIYKYPHNNKLLLNLHAQDGWIIMVMVMVTYTRIQIYVYLNFNYRPTCVHVYLVIISYGDS